MPRYDFRCRECEQSFEITLSLVDTDRHAVTCPAGHENVTRVWSAVSLAGRSTAPSASGPAGCCGGGCCR